MVRKVWFQLVNERGGELTPIECVEAAAYVSVARFQNQLKKKFAGHLYGIAPSDLTVFRNRAAFDGKKEKGLEVDLVLGALGAGKDEALAVVVPDQPMKRQRTQNISWHRMNELVSIVAIVEQLNGEEDLKAGKLLKVPQTIFGTFFDNGMYIRQEFWDLYELIQQELSSNKSIRRVLVLGSPGIGKSVFGVFLLFLFMTQKKDVAYQASSDSSVNYFSWSSSNSYEISDAPLIGRKYEGFFDEREGRQALRYFQFNHAFLFASPRSENYHHFAKDSCFEVFMNPWAKAECQGLADALQLENQDEWQRRFDLVGRKPRFVFSSCQSFDLLVHRVQSQTPRNMDMLKEQVRLFQQREFDDRVLHIAFTMYRDENLPSCFYLTFSSPTVEAIMNARARIESGDEIRSVLHTPTLSLKA